MVTLHTLGYNSVQKFTPIMRIFFIIPPEHSAPPFWFYIYGTKGLILIPHYFKYFIIYNFYVIILLSHLNTVGNTFY